MELRKRQRIPEAGAGDRPVSSVQSVKARSKGESIDRTFTRGIAVVAILILVTGTALFFRPNLMPKAVRRAVDRALFKAGLHSERQHAVIVDAGSTGSRVLGFKFHRSLVDGSLILDEELWKEVKPGLSAYAENPSECRQGLNELLEAAQETIPPEDRPNTPVSVKATAGLRMLPKHQSEAIIAVVQETMQKSGFKPEDNLIEIMSPLDEGLFGWFTVNFLLESMGDLGNSFTTLDLGGGSTQITFSPKEHPVEGLKGRKHFIHNVSTPYTDQMSVYSHSYLGLGLMAARNSVLHQESNSDGRVASGCYIGDRPQHFSFHGEDYTIVSKSGGSSSFESCKKLVDGVVKAEDVHQPKELAEREVVAFSYFFDLAVESKLIGTGEFQKVVKVIDYKTKAAEACSDANSGFRCLDLTYIYSLLTTGYGFSDDKEVSLIKKIDGHETSWALGLAFNILDNVSVNEDL